MRIVAEVRRGYAHSKECSEYVIGFSESELRKIVHIDVWMEQIAYFAGREKAGGLLFKIGASSYWILHFNELKELNRRYKVLIGASKEKNDDLLRENEELRRKINETGDST